MDNTSHENQQEDLSCQVEKDTSKEWQDKYLRTLAEMENLRKRLQKEKSDMLKFAVENVIADFLMPLDQLENALNFTDHMSAETKNWAYGFQMILAQFKDTLEQHSVRPFQSVGMQFNPHDHEAVETEITEEHPEGTILVEFTKGYRCGDRILRPARVKVAKKPAPAPSEEVKEETTN